MGYFPAHEAKTTLSCPRCGGKMDIVRACHEAHMHCPSCGGNFPLKNFIEQADEAMEAFLDTCYLDRL